MVIQVKELTGEECKLKKVCRKIRHNAIMNDIEVEKAVHSNGEKIKYWFSVRLTTKISRLIHFWFPYSIRFWAVLDTKTYTLTIGNVNEELFDKVYRASKVLFSDIEELTVIIEKDYC